MSVAFEADTWGMFVRRADRFGVQLTDVLSIYFFFPCPFHSKNLRRLVNLKKKYVSCDYVFLNCATRNKMYYIHPIEHTWNIAFVCLSKQPYPLQPQHTVPLISLGAGRRGNLSSGQSKSYISSW